MTCRESALSSVMATFARGTTGLEDSQVLSLNHALMRAAGTDAAAPTQEEWNAYIDQVRSQYESGELQAPRGSRRLLERLEAARTEIPTGPRWYAAQALLHQCRSARAEHEGWLRRYASRTGLTMEQAQERFSEQFAAAGSNPHLEPADDAGSGTLRLRDRRSLYAYQTLEAEANERFDRASEPTVSLASTPGSSAIAGIGWDASTGRCEVQLRSNPDRIYAYHMTQDEFHAFLGADSMGSHYARHIRNNPDMRLDRDTARDTATRSRCATCGEFTGREGHSCPPNGSPEATERDLNAAVARRRGETVTPPAPFVASRRRDQVIGADGNVFMSLPFTGRIQQDARRHGRVRVPVTATYSGVMVHGNVEVEYAARGTYRAAATRELRCTCPDYQANYDCEHVRDAVTRAALHVGGGDAAGMPFGSVVDEAQMSRLQAGIDAENADVATATSAVTANLEAESVAAAAQVETNNAGWTPSGTNMMENPEEFQVLYDEARAARAAWKAAIEAGEEAPEFPVPYLTENAFGGLASRESGRGFGIEVEFNLPETMSYEEQRAARAAIGRKLRYAGLTSDSRQMGYGSTHGRYSEEQDGGWSYESDPTVSGGEIVSPVMFDEPKTWENIQKVCDIVREHGGTAKIGGAGMHVHVGTGDYDHDVENHSRLVALQQENEDLVYRMSMNPERGRHRGTAYCGPNRELAGPYRNVEDARYQNTGHHLSLNLQSVSGGSRDHVEFRTFDGSLNPAVMQAHIGMAVYMAAGATRPDSVDPRQIHRRPLGERYDANPRRNALSGDAWNESTESIRGFVDRLVPGDPGTSGKDNPRVRQMVALFASTKWVQAPTSRW